MKSLRDMTKAELKKEAGLWGIKLNSKMMQGEMYNKIVRESKRFDRKHLREVAADSTWKAMREAIETDAKFGARQPQSQSIMGDNIVKFVPEGYRSHLDGDPEAYFHGIELPCGLSTMIMPVHNADLRKRSDWRVNVSLSNDCPELDKVAREAKKRRV